MRASLVFLALLAACPSIPVPAEHIPAPEDLGRQPTGSWIAIWDRQGGLIVGELIAIDRGSVFVLPSNRRLVALPVDEVDHARLVAYDARSSGLGWWGGLGTLSTISHGALLIITAPVWLLGTTGAVIWNKHGALEDVPDRSLEEIRAWARFPQGLPAGADPEVLLGTATR